MKLEFRRLFEKYRYIVFQNVLLSLRTFTFKLVIYYLFFSFSVKSGFCWFFYLSQLSVVLFLLNLFLSFDHAMISFFSNLFMKVLWIKRRSFILTGATSFKVFRKIYSNTSELKQMGESKNGCYKKTKHAKFSEKQTILIPWYNHPICS